MNSTAEECPCGCTSYGQHLRNKGISVGYANSVKGWDYSKQQKWDRELSRYRDLTASGVEPEGTTHREMDQAERALN